MPHANVLFSGETAATGYDTGSLVLDGRYHIAREFGLPPGRYRARVSLLEADGFVPRTDQPPGEDREVRMRQAIPPPFSTEGVLVTVVAGRPNVFDFDIP